MPCRDRQSRLFSCVLDMKSSHDDHHLSGFGRCSLRFRACAPFVIACAVGLPHNTQIAVICLVFQKPPVIRFPAVTICSLASCSAWPDIYLLAFLYGLATAGTLRLISRRRCIRFLGIMPSSTHHFSFAIYPAPLLTFNSMSMSSGSTSSS